MVLSEEAYYLIGVSDIFHEPLRNPIAASR